MWLIYITAYLLLKKSSLWFNKGWTSLVISQVICLVQVDAYKDFQHLTEKKAFFAEIQTVGTISEIMVPAAVVYYIVFDFFQFFLAFLASAR